MFYIKQTAHCGWGLFARVHLTFAEVQAALYGFLTPIDEVTFATLRDGGHPSLFATSTQHYILHELLSLVNHQCKSKASNANHVMRVLFTGTLHRCISVEWKSHQMLSRNRWQHRRLWCWMILFACCGSSQQIPTTAVSWPMRRSVSTIGVSLLQNVAADLVLALQLLMQMLEMKQTMTMCCHCQKKKKKKKRTLLERGPKQSDESPLNDKGHFYSFVHNP